MILVTSNVVANECVICPPIAPASEFVCGVDEKGIVKRFGSECVLRFENCEHKTSELHLQTKVRFIKVYIHSRVPISWKIIMRVAC